MSAYQLATFGKYIFKADISDVQRDVARFIYNSTATTIAQVTREKTLLSGLAFTKAIYKLMAIAHRFVELSGSQKKEVVLHTILGGLTVQGIESSPDQIFLIENTIDVVWWASHDAIFAIKKQCSLLCKGPPSKMAAKCPLKMDSVDFKSSLSSTHAPSNHTEVDGPEFVEA